MLKRIKTVSIAFIIIILLSIIFCAIYFIIDNIHREQLIKKVSDLFIEENIEYRLETAEGISDLYAKVDGNEVLGVIKIEKINFEGLVYEGTDLSILKKGVGHFKSTPIINGNVCLAAHNTEGFWKNLHTLEDGDVINYTSMLGTKKYKVFSIKQIDETDLNCLVNTQNNILTLITCVKNNKPKRLCVQALEFE